MEHVENDVSKPSSYTQIITVIENTIILKHFMVSQLETFHSNRKRNASWNLIIKAFGPKPTKPHLEAQKPSVLKLTLGDGLFTKHFLNDLHIQKLHSQQSQLIQTEH